jgi:fumarate reductase subunit D
MTNRKSPEPLLWLLFSAGGMAAALLVPALLFLFGIAFPLGWLTAPEHPYLLSVLQHPVTRLVLFGLCVLSLFHWAHRFRYTLYDGLRLKRLSAVIILGCYGGAVVGSAAAGFVLLRV